ncbi:activating signal cointegrator 1 complex subunit 1-like isoform X1 [Corticium candelabrum]|uniref:activating signal cointegrator 1 complex subunit 1-like isoform X1 n=1 Tax=Corticium candelabrum TaxID=121492 RepID=UPI002E25CC05|nr:activating signal cointegrator 1 complex subunit 1-like isoform X1 [Corticium candelabrum]
MDDILRPEIFHLNGRLYRKNPVNTDDEISTDRWLETGAGEVASQLQLEDIPDDEETSHLTKTSEGFQVSLSLPSAFYKFIIGRQGETKKQLERETKTSIKVPSKGSTAAANIVITGSDRSGVLAATRRVQMLGDEGRSRHEWTHFLSIPLNTTSIMKQFEQFKEAVMTTCAHAQGLDSSIFQNPHKLHLTIGVLKLCSHEEEEKACDLLSECSRTVVKSELCGRPAIIQIQGLEYMNDDPSAVDVLYGKVSLADGSDRLQCLVDQLVKHFTDAGLMQQDYTHIMQREYGDVKMHVTLMNTKLRKEQQRLEAESSRTHRRKYRESFDAIQIFQEFGQFQFGEAQLKSIHLSERHNTSADGYYATRCQISL